MTPDARPSERRWSTPDRNSRAHRPIHRLGLHRPAAKSWPLLIAVTSPAAAFDINEQFAINGIVAGAGQCQDATAQLPGEDYGQPIEGSGPLQFDTSLDQFDNTCRGAMPVQVELSYRPTERDEIFIKLGAAVDNALNAATPFRLAPWAADLKDDVEDINSWRRSSRPAVSVVSWVR